MAVGVFSDDWAAQWQASINQSSDFRQFGHSWMGSMILALEREDAGGTVRAAAVYARFRDGRCLQAKKADGDDLEKAGFIIGASEDTWKGLLQGALDPMFAVLQGRLHLRKGKTADLLPYAQAAKAMLSAAKDIETDFESWRSASDSIAD